MENMPTFLAEIKIIVIIRDIQADNEIQAEEVVLNHKDVPRQHEIIEMRLVSTDYGQEDSDKIFDTGWYTPNFT